MYDNKFSEIKSILTCRQVVEKFLGQPDKRTNNGDWYKSPFRNERTASMYVTDSKGIHDFGSSEHYDIISFVEKYLNLTPLEALKTLYNTFGLEFGEQTYEEKKKIKQVMQEREIQNKLKIEAEECYKNNIANVCDKLILNKKLQQIFENTFYFETLKILYDEEVKLELEFESLHNMTEDEKNKELFLWKKERK